MKNKLVIFFFVFSIMFLNSEVFKFKYSPGQKQRIECSINGVLFINGIFQSKYFQKYKTVSSINSFDGNTAKIEEENFFFNTINFSNNQTQEIKETILTNYSKDQSGRMIVKVTDIFPTLRNAPYFPEISIEPGYKWNYSGFEAQNIFVDKVITIFPIEIYYEFVGYEIIEGKKISKFNYEYTIDTVNNSIPNMDPRILRILGNSKTILYFDNTTGSKVKEQYERHYFFVINTVDGPYVSEFVDEGERIWFSVELMKKDKIMDDIKKDLKDKKITDARVEKDKRGVKISLDNIQFEPESAVLLDSEKQRLNKIAEILKKYKTKDTMFIGHTTDKGTEEGRQKLSLERAISVVDYLITKNAIEPSKSSYLGKGGTEPIANNSTDEGMKKNRRVEIYILEE